MNQEFYLYRHLRNDTGEVFYIGVGKQRIDRGKHFHRAKSFDRKNPHWHAIVKRHGYTIEIMTLCRTLEEAYQKERFFINLYGRKESGGPLTNLTNGGKGRRGGVWTTEDRRKMREKFVGRTLPAEVGRKISAAKKGIATSIQKGDTLPECWRERIRKTKFGARNPMFGRTASAHHLSRRVVDRKTGTIYPSVTAAGELFGIPMKSLHNMLTGFRENKTTLEFYAP